MGLGFCCWLNGNCTVGCGLAGMCCVFGCGLRVLVYGYCWFALGEIAVVCVGCLFGIALL